MAIHTQSICLDLLFFLVLWPDFPVILLKSMTAAGIVSSSSRPMHGNVHSSGGGARVCLERACEVVAVGDDACATCRRSVVGWEGRAVHHSVQAVGRRTPEDSQASVVMTTGNPTNHDGKRGGGGKNGSRDRVDISHGWDGSIPAWIPCTPSMTSRAGSRNAGRR